jgi:hypothetical protein
MFVTINGIAVESPINVNIIFRLVKSNFVGSSDFKKLMVSKACMDQLEDKF